MATLQSALIGRIEADIYRQIGLEQVAARAATGKGAFAAVPGFVEALRREGVTAFVDKAGRRWSLHTYCSMVSRTTYRQAQTLAALTADPEHDLYRISSHGTTCALCAPYEGRVYSKSGTDPVFPPLADAFGTMDKAGPKTLANSWLNIHPNCQHSISPWTPAGKSKGELREIEDFSNPRKAGIIAVGLDEGDYLIGAALTDGNHDVMLFSDAGKAVRFDENDVRPMGRTARGVKGMTLDDEQKVIALLVAGDESQSVLTATENGFGKRTPIAEYTRHGRGTKGMIAIQTSERNGKVVAATLVNENDEIMLITTGGVLIRTRVSEIREMGRATQGVTLIAVEEGTTLSGLQRIMESDIDDASENA